MSSAWEKTKQGSKAGFDKGWQLFEKLGAPVNKVTNKIGSEAFWPTTLDKVSLAHFTFHISPVTSFDVELRFISTLRRN